MPGISQKNKIFLFFCVFCKIGLVSNHLWNNSFIWHYLDELLDSENGTKKQKKFYGGQFSERVSVFGWLYIGNSK